MQLVISLLVIIVAILSFLAGLTVLIGSRKSEKERGTWLSLAALAAGVFAVFITVFLSLPAKSAQFAKPIVGTIYVSALVIPLAFSAFLAWPHKLGRGATGVFALAFLGLLLAFLAKNTLFYTRIAIGSEGNAVTLNTGSWYFPAVIAYTVGILVEIMAVMIYNIWSTKSARRRRSLSLATVGILLAYGLMAAFGLVVPFYASYSYIVVAPLVAGLFIVAFYYAILRYKVIMLDAKWLKALSYIIIMTAAAGVYMVIFFLVVTLLFKIEDLPSSIFVLNFIMISIVLLLIPAINEAMSVITARIKSGQVNMTYVLKRLNDMAVTMDEDSITELADFLADYLHFSFIGIVVKGKLYGSTSTKLTTGELKEVMNLGEPERGVWQEYGGVTESILSSARIEAVAAMRDAKGKPFGQMIVGRPSGKKRLERRDLIQLEMVVNLTGAMIDTAAVKARKKTAKGKK